jgi:hypothetical protein
MPARKTAVLVIGALALTSCGGDSSKVDSASYTCARFQKSLKTKGDDTSGNYINQLRKQAKLGQAKETEVQEITLGIYFACRNASGSTRPAQKAIATAKLIRAGKFRLPRGPKPKKKSTK